MVKTPSKYKKLYSFRLLQICPKKRLKPPVYKYYQVGNKINNSHLCQLRVGHSKLNSHLFSKNLIQSPACLCHCPSETPSHYLLSCWLYQEERQNLLSFIQKYIPNFLTFNLRKQLNILLNGINPDDCNFNHTNS